MYDRAAIAAASTGGAKSSTPRTAADASISCETFRSSICSWIAASNSTASPMPTGSRA